MIADLSDEPARTLVESAAMLRRREMDSEDLMTRMLENIRERDGELGSFIHVYADSATAAARECDSDAREGRWRGPLHGVPIAVKDNIATRESITTGNSRVFDPAWMRGEDAIAVQRLRSAGAIIIGKTTLMEHACGLPQPGSDYPLPRNPWDKERFPGGSSSGSASAVVADFCLGALGTDTGASVRWPAAHTGLTALRPTHGRVPTEGLMPASPSLDVIGPMATSAADVRLLFDVLTGEHRDRERSTPTLAGITIAVDQSRIDPMMQGTGPRESFHESIAILSDLGATVVDITLPLWEAATAASMISWWVEGYGIHRDLLRQRWTDYGTSARSVLAQGLLLTADDYQNAKSVRAQTADALGRVFESVDIVATPTMATSAFPYIDGRVSGVDVAIENSFTEYWSAVGFPALALPTRPTEGLPNSLQLAAPRGREELLLKTAEALQNATNWHLARPERRARARIEDAAVSAALRVCGIPLSETERKALAEAASGIHNKATLIRNTIKTSVSLQNPAPPSR